MERLPYIDEHSIQIGATRERVWPALVSVVHGSLGRIAPAPLIGPMEVSPGRSSGDWSGTPHPGDALPAFEVGEVISPERLELCGRHRFSRYALVFELDATGVDSCTLRARTWAEFPGLGGHIYRTLVIGTRVHRLVVRRLLRDVARRA